MAEAAVTEAAVVVDAVVAADVVVAAAGVDRINSMRKHK